MDKAHRTLEKDEERETEKKRGVPFFKKPLEIKHGKDMTLNTCIVLSIVNVQQKKDCQDTHIYIYMQINERILDQMEYA